MAIQMKRDILLKMFLISLLCILITSHCTETDIFCLRSLKNSLEDPNNYLASSWDFVNNTEGFICRFNGVECWHPDENRVLNLKLSNMGLKGQFPRGLNYCSSLTGLDLSSNELTGPIPSDINELIPFVTRIDLSSNKFSGEIPASLANCTYLNTLRLDDNMLTGQIPREFGLLSRIKTITFSGNRGLCGEPWVPCSVDTSNEFHQSLKTGLIVGYAFSVIASVSVAFTSYSNRESSANRHLKKANQLGRYICSITRKGTLRLIDHMSELSPLQQQVEKRSKEISVLLERLTSTLRVEELHAATDCFALDNAIGVGKMGVMYQGKQPCGQFIAVKKLHDSQLFTRQFLSEIMILGKHRHRNLVPLLGFCIEREERILAYPYMSNGRLSKWLHPLESEVMRLKWPHRVNIALGIARGLSWLHHSCNLHIVHLNICSECILLDQNFEPKISNFGEAKFMDLNIENNDLGTVFSVNDGKKDVYDFGSVLYELITGKTYDELCGSSSTINLCGSPSNFYSAIDKSLIEVGFANDLCTLIKIACECVHPLPDQRPTMLEVYTNMSNIWKEPEGCTDESDTPRGLEIASIISEDEIVEL